MTSLPQMLETLEWFRHGCSEAVCAPKSRELLGSSSMGSSTPGDGDGDGDLGMRLNHMQFVCNWESK